MKSQKDFI